MGRMVLFGQLGGVGWLRMSMDSEVGFGFGDGMLRRCASGGELWRRSRGNIEDLGLLARF